MRSIIERRDTEELLRILGEEAPLGMCIIQNGKFRYLNSNFGAATGYAADELMGRDSLEIVAPEDREAVRTDTIRMLKGKLLSPYQFRVIHKDGSIVWMMASVKSVQYHGRQAILGTYMETTERRRVEERIRDSEKRYRLLAENIADVIWTVSATCQTRLTYISPSMTRLLGYSVEESMGKEMKAIFTSASFRTAMKVFAEEMSGGQNEHGSSNRSRRLELQLRHKSGASIEVEVNSSFIRGADGQEDEVVAMVRDITGRKQMQGELVDSKQRYEELANSITDVFFAMDEQLRCTYWNKASEILTGIPEAHAIGKSFGQIFPDTPGVRGSETACRNALNKQQVQSFVAEFVLDGRHLTFEISVYPSRGGVSVFGRDITGRKQAEETLEKSEERYRTFVQNAGEAIFVVQDGMIKFMNPKGKELSGYSLEELASRPFVQFIHPDDINMVVDRYTRRLRGAPAPQGYEFRIIRKEGTVRWGELNAVPISWEGEPAVLCFMSDVSDRRQAEEAVRQSEERYRTILEEMGDGYFETDLAGNMTFANDALCSLFGYSKEELVGMNYRVFTPEDDVHTVFEAYNTVYKTGEPLRDFNRRIIRKDGTYAFARSSVFPMRNDKGETIGFRGVRHDITEQRQAEERLAESEKKYRLLFETSPDCITQIDGEGRYLAANPATAESLGVPLKDLIGKTVFEVMPEEIAELRFQNIRRVLDDWRPQVYEDSRAGRYFHHIVIPLRTLDQKEAVQAITRDITERRKMEEALRQGEEKHKALFDSSVIGMFVMDAETMKIVMCNQAAASMFGLDSIDEAVGISPVDFIHPEEREKDLAIIMNDMFERDLRHTHEFRALTRDGREGWISVTGARIMHEGRLAGLVSITNINRRKKAEEALRRSEERYRTILEEMEDAYFEVDLAGHLTFVNNATCRALGYSEEELIGMSYKEFTAEEDIEPVFRVFNEVYRSGVPNMGFSWKIVSKAGTHRLVEHSAFPLRNERDEIIGFRGVGRDVTGRKQAEEKLRQSEENYKTLFNSSVVGMYVLDVETFKVVMGNPAAANMAGFSSTGEGIGINPLEFVVPEDREQLLEVAGNEFEQDLRRTHEVRVVGKDGRTGWITISSAKIMHEGKPAALVSITDITERKRMEEALRQSEENYRALFDSSVIGTIVFDSETKRIVISNQAAAKMFGLSSADEAVGMNPLDFIPPEDRARVLEIATRELFEQDLRHTHELRAITGDGREIWISITGARITHEGRLAGLISFTDVTEQKRQRERLMMTDRLASLGELAAGTAHELNNPLTSIIGFSQLLMEKKVPDDIREDLKLINSEAQRAAAVTKNLLTFARRRAPVKQPNQINSIVEDVLELRGHAQRTNGIEIERHLSPDLPEIMVDYFQMQQVFLNIIINAEYFMTEAHNGGTLSITTKKRNGSVLISIADDGPGIPPENLARIFDPFFTTKEPGKGTGLGLSICHGIVTEHGGQIYVRSTLGKGTTVSVELPINHH